MIRKIKFVLSKEIAFNDVWLRSTPPHKIPQDKKKIGLGVCSYGNNSFSFPPCKYIRSLMKLSPIFTLLTIWTLICVISVTLLLLTE